MSLPSAEPADHRAAVFAGFLGWTLDAFDFFLVVMTLTAIAQEFHRSGAAVAFSITLTLAFAYQCGVLIAGSIATIEALLAARVGYGWAMAATAGTVFTLCAVVAAAGAERRGIAYGATPAGSTG